MSLDAGKTKVSQYKSTLNENRNRFSSIPRMRTWMQFGKHYFSVCGPSSGISTRGKVRELPHGAKRQGAFG